MSVVQMNRRISDRGPAAAAPPPGLAPAESALSGADSLFEQIIEAAPNAMVMVDGDGRIVLVNAEAERLFGYSRSELLCMSVDRLLPERARADHPAQRKTYFSVPRTRSMGVGRELFGLTRAGREVPVEIGIKPVHASGRTYVLASIIDISERRAHEAALRDREARVSAIFSQSNDAIIVTDRAGLVIQWNHAAERMFLYTEAEAIGRSGVELIVPTDLLDEEMQRLERVAQGESVPNFESIGKRKDGSTLAVSVTESPIRLPTGEIMGAATIVRDISEQKRARLEQQRLTQSLEQQFCETCNALNNLRDAQDQLVQAEKMASLGGLVAGVAHEINTPIGTGVTAASHLSDEARRLARAVADGKLTKKAFEEFLDVCQASSQIILSNLERAANLIQSFKRVAVDQSTEERRTIDVRGYFEEVLLSLRPQLKHTPHRIELSCEDGLELTTVPGAWSQVITNLVMNAVTHAFEEGQAGTVGFSARREGSNLLVGFSDNGRGMSAEVLEHAFDPFFTTRRANGGTGLGLNIVFNLVNQTLGGKIEVSSKPGEGCVFNIKVPLVVDAKENRHAI